MEVNPGSEQQRKSVSAIKTDEFNPVIISQVAQTVRLHVSGKTEVISN